MKPNNQLVELKNFVSVSEAFFVGLVLVRSDPVLVDLMSSK
jgi:hypothetical protein